MNTWHRHAPLVRAERRRIAGVAAIALAGIVVEVALPWPLKLVIDHLLAGVALPAPVAWIGALPGAGSTGGLIGWLSAALLLLVLAAQGLGLAQGVMQADLGARLRVALGGRILDHLQALSLAWHRRERQGDLLRRVTDDADCLATGVNEVVLPTFTAVVTLAVLFAVIWQLDPPLALCAVAVALPMGLAMRRLGPRMTDRADDHERAQGGLWAATEQTLSALPLVQAYDTGRTEQARFVAVSDRSVRASLRSVSTQLQFRVGVDAIEAVGIAAVMAFGGLRVVDGAMTVGTLVVAISYMAALYAPLVGLAYLAATVATAGAGARRVAAVLDAGDRVVDAPTATPLPPPRAGGATLRFEGVVFGYAPGRPVLRGVDLAVDAGEVVALVGASGAGKSTLAALVPRLYDPWQGRVRLDGRDLRDATVASVRDRVAMVLQDPFLLPLTVAENIAYARPSATRGEVEAAARAARADGFVAALPQGYDTVVGERGATLSGGQRQRIAIARALLKDARILLMDEPTSALDAATERELLDAIAALMRGRTTLVIAHRLSTIRRADRIAVLDGGRIVETGSHDALVARSGFYRALVGAQTGTAIAATESAG